MVRTLLIAALAVLPSLAGASDLERLAREGYAIVAETRIQGPFDGCHLDKRIALENRQVFVCASSSFQIAFQPEVLILKHAGREDVKVLVDGRELEGKLTSDGGC
jgi:hypothetical protein